MSNTDDRENKNTPRNRDIGKLIFKIAILVFIVFFISRWFAGGSTESSEIHYQFRNQKLLDQHYEKHGIEMGFESAEEYEAAASAVVTNPTALHKLEEEDGDDVFYIEDTGEFVVVSTDGFIRTYYYASKAYYDRQ